MVLAINGSAYTINIQTKEELTAKERKKLLKTIGDILGTKLIKGVEAAPPIRLSGPERITIFKK